MLLNFFGIFKISEKKPQIRVDCNDCGIEWRCTVSELNHIIAPYLTALTVPVCLANIFRMNGQAEFKVDLLTGPMFVGRFNRSTDGPA